MQKQNINLYRTFETPRSVSQALPWKSFWFLQTLFITVFFLAYLISLWDVHSLKTKRSNLTAEATLLQNKFEKIKATYPPIFFSQDVDQSLGQLKQQFSLEERVLKNISNATSFSQFLAALGKIIVLNVWLTEMTFAQGGDEIILKGQNRGINNLQAFIRNIDHEKLFFGYVVTINNIESINKDVKNNLTTFEIKIAKQST